jgi:hypothetical protein
MVLTLDYRSGKMATLHWDQNEMLRFERAYRAWLESGKPYGEFRHREEMGTGPIISCIPFHEINGRRISGTAEELAALD